MQAVKDGSYVEIKSTEGAKCYLTSLLRKNLETELKAAQSKVLAEFKALKQSSVSKIVLEARDVFFAAAALGSRKFLIGAGDRSAFLKMVLENNPTEIPDLYRKL